ncbi:MAG: hypothetical protein IPI02_17405 [Sterolibacteriaceae bacterium]|nr:hypothetical protein [Sterolibacteriaceae bacterium]
MAQVQVESGFSIRGIWQNPLNCEFPWEQSDYLNRVEFSRPGSGPISTIDGWLFAGGGTPILLMDAVAGAVRQMPWF